MNDLLLLIDKLPELMLYLVQGYIFIGIFEYITFNTGRNDIKHLFIKSVISSYLLKVSFDLINGFLAQIIGRYIMSDKYFYVIFLIIYSIILAYILSQIIFSKRFNKLLPKLRISRNVYNSIWLDIKDDDYGVWVTVKDNGNNLYYRGVLDTLESFAREPIIILARYQVIDEDGDILDDYYMEARRKLVLDMSEYKKFELYYHENSKNIADTKSVIDSEKSVKNK